MITHPIPLGARVALICSGETGQVVGRSEHVNAGPQVLVRYCGADGRAGEAWWSTDAVMPLPDLPTRDTSATVASRAAPFSEDQLQWLQEALQDAQPWCRNWPDSIRHAVQAATEEVVQRLRSAKGYVS